jgi:hypothetical protein
MTVENYSWAILRLSLLNASPFVPCDWQALTKYKMGFVNSAKKIVIFTLCIIK